MLRTHVYRGGIAPVLDVNIGERTHPWETHTRFRTPQIGVGDRPKLPWAQNLKNDASD